MTKLDSSKIYQAILLGRDNQSVSNGEARFLIGASRGVFWPRDGAKEDTILKNGATVKTSEDHLVSIHNVSRCPTESERHYDFQFDPLA